MCAGVAVFVGIEKDGRPDWEFQAGEIEVNGTTYTSPSCSNGCHPPEPEFVISMFGPPVRLGEKVVVVCG